MSTGWRGMISRRKESGSGPGSGPEFLALDGVKSLLTLRRKIVLHGLLRVMGGGMAQTFGTGHHAATTCSIYVRSDLLQVNIEML